VHRVSLDLACLAPLDAAALLDHFAVRAVAGIERVDGDTYTRWVVAGVGTGPRRRHPRVPQRAGLTGDPHCAATLARPRRPYRSYALQYLWTL
jgi:hypothetical protein